MITTYSTRCQVTQQCWTKLPFLAALLGPCSTTAWSWASLTSISSFMAAIFFSRIRYLSADFCCISRIDSLNLVWISSRSPEQLLWVILVQTGRSYKWTLTGSYFGQWLKNNGRAHACRATNSWGHGFKSCRELGFFLLFSILSVVHPLFRSLTEAQHYWFSY